MLMVGYFVGDSKRIGWFLWLSRLLDLQRACAPRRNFPVGPKRLVMIHPTSAISAVYLTNSHPFKRNNSAVVWITPRMLPRSGDQAFARRCHESLLCEY